MALNRKHLGIYLNDHLAASTAGVALAARALGSNRGNSFGRSLEPLHAEIEEDRETLRAVMRRLGLKEDPVKRVAAAAGERAGRLKLNGSLFSYSPLSRLVEIEALTIGVDGKLALWVDLAELPREGGLEEFDFGALADRARAQREELEEQRRAAARIALTD